MKVSTKELLELASNKEVELQAPTSKMSEEVHQFVFEMKIKEGKHLVPTSVIYEAYKSWSKKPSTRKYFFFRFEKLFRNTKSQPIKYYLNYKPLELLNKVFNSKINIS